MHPEGTVTKSLPVNEAATDWAGGVLWLALKLSCELVQVKNAVSGFSGCGPAEKTGVWTEQSLSARGHALRHFECTRCLIFSGRSTQC